MVQDQHTFRFRKVSVRRTICNVVCEYSRLSSPRPSDEERGELTTGYLYAPAFYCSTIYILYTGLRGAYRLSRINLNTIDLYLSYE